MIRAVCLVCRDYSPSSEKGEVSRRFWHLAQALSSQGCAVHIIAAATNGIASIVFDDAVIVHRVRQPEMMGPELEDVDQTLWASLVAETYRKLDALVAFDVVIGSDASGEIARIVPAPNTALVVEIHHGNQLLRDLAVDPFCLPVRRSSAELALAGLERADLIIAPDDESAAMLAGRVTPKIITIAPPLCPSAPGEPIQRRQRALELCYLGDLSADNSPELAIAVLARLRSQGTDARLTLIGGDRRTGRGGDSYRRSKLLPILAGLDDGYGAVRLIDSLSQDALLERLRSTDVAIQPNFLSSFSFDAITLLESGVSIITRTPLSGSHEITPDEGLVVLSDIDDGTFVDQAARYIGTTRGAKLRRESARGWVHSRFDADENAERYIEALKQVVPAALPFTTRRPSTPTPKLSIAMLTDGTIPDTVRAVSSLLAHTDLPFTLTLVADDGTDLSTVTALDPRVDAAFVAPAASLSERCNSAIGRLERDADYLVLVDNHIEVLHRWWVPLLATFDTDPNIGIVSESGTVLEMFDGTAQTSTASTGLCDLPDRYCLMIRRLTLDRVGLFEVCAPDPSLGLADFALRARRVGELTAAANSGWIFHRTQASLPQVPGLLVDLVRRHAARPSSLFHVLADLDEAVADPGILSSFARAFCAGDEVTLTLWPHRPERDAAEYLHQIGERAIEAGLDLENGPRLDVVLPEQTTAVDLDELVADAHCVLSTQPPTGAFQHLAWLDVDEGDDLRILAARAWAARHPRETSV